MDNKRKYTFEKSMHSGDFEAASAVAPKFTKNILLDSYAKIDITDITIILQCMGFTLQLFEKSETSHEKGLDTINIDLSCSKSGIRASMTKKLDMCKCPSNPEDGKIWNVSGCGPRVKDEIIESNCSLLPKVADQSRQIIKNVMIQILPLINEKENYLNGDNGFKQMKSVALLSRFRSLDTLITASPPPKEISTKVVNIAQAWEIDPKTTPPANTSSPRPSLKEPLLKLKQNVVDMVNQIQNIIDNNIPDANSTFSAKSKNIRRVSDIEPVQKPLTPKLPMPTGEFLAKKRRKLISPKIIPISPFNDKVKIVPTSKVGSFRTKNVTPKQDTPRPMRPVLPNRVASNSKMPTPTIGKQFIPKITPGSTIKK